MQDLLIYAIEFVVIAFAALMVMDFVGGLIQPVQHQGEASSETIEQPDPKIEQPQQRKVATKEWVLVVDEDEEVEPVNVIELAKARQPELEPQPQSTKRKPGRKKNIIPAPAPTTTTAKRKPGRPCKAA